MGLRTEERKTACFLAFFPKDPLGSMGLIQQSTKENQASVTGRRHLCPGWVLRAQVAEDTGGWSGSLSKHGCTEGGMGGADLKDQLPCQEMGLGGLPSGQAKPGAGIPGSADVGKGESSVALRQPGAQEALAGTWGTT